MQVSQAARVTRNPNLVRSRRADPRQRDTHLGMQLDDQRDDAAAELHTGRAQRIRCLCGMAALFPPLTR